MTISAEAGSRHYPAAGPALAEWADGPRAFRRRGAGRGKGTEGPGAGGHRGGPRRSLDLAELVAVAEDEVHVLVEGLEGADEDAAILQDAPHPVVDVLQHLAALSHRLQETTVTPGAGVERGRPHRGGAAPLAARARRSARLTMAAVLRAPSRRRRRRRRLYLCRRRSLRKRRPPHRKPLRAAAAASARPHAAAPPPPRTAASGARWMRFRGRGQARRGGGCAAGRRPAVALALGEGGCRARPRRRSSVPYQPRARRPAELRGRAALHEPVETRSRAAAAGPGAGAPLARGADLSPPAAAPKERSGRQGQGRRG